MMCNSTPFGWPNNEPVKEQVNIGYSCIIENTKNTFSELDKVYHSSTMHEMQVNADLNNVDLCNPYVLFFLAKETTYHHAFWPHTAKRFTAFKNLLRHNKDVKKSFGDMKFWTLVQDEYNKLDDEINKNVRWKYMPGRQQELKNWEQIISIVEKAICNSKK